MLDDSDGLYTDSLIRAFRVLAQTGAPTGVTFTQPGVILRDYPLALLIYTAFVAGTVTMRGDVLKRILTVPVLERAGRAREPLAESLVRTRRARELFNTALETRYCEPMPLRIRQVLANTVGNRLIPEAESFFCGEFVLALTLIDHRLTKKYPSDYLVPLPGLYLYTTEANDAISPNHRSGSQRYTAILSPNYCTFSTPTLTKRYRLSALVRACTGYRRQNSTNPPHTNSDDAWQSAAIRLSLFGCSTRARSNSLTQTNQVHTTLLALQD